MKRLAYRLAARYNHFQRCLNARTHNLSQELTMEDPEDLLSVYQAANSTEAYMVKNLLADEGIESSVSEENEPLAGLPMVPPDVLVRRRDLAQAEAIIADYEEH